jgi:hypothetical protein
LGFQCRTIFAADYVIVWIAVRNYVPFKFIEVELASYLKTEDPTSCLKSEIK